MADPIQVLEALGRLIVVGKGKVVRQGDGEPHEVRAEEEELSRQQGDPPAGGSDSLILGYHSLMTSTVGGGGEGVPQKQIMVLIYCVIVTVTGG